MVYFNIVRHIYTHIQTGTKVPESAPAADAPEVE